MSENSNTAGAGQRRRGPLFWVLGGCGALVACVLCALAANAVYWTIVGPPSGLGQPSADVTAVSVADLPAGDADDGRSVFNSTGCSACHSLDPDVKFIGPSLAGIGERAATRVPDTTAEAYLLESIVNPNAFVVPGFTGGIMPGNFSSQLSEQELADLVAFLLTQ